MTAPPDPRDLAVAAAYFDGRGSSRHDVVVRIEHGDMLVAGPGVARRAALADVEISQPLGSAPRLIRFADGAFCAVEEHAAFAALLAAHGVHAARVTQWEGSLGWVWASIVVFVVLVVLGYRYGVPLAASAVAARVPEAAVDLISRQTLQSLDQAVLQPSALPRARQQALAGRFQQLRWPGGSGASRYEVVFRRSDVLGANALALPSGTLILTDALVALARHDDEVMAVLAHEAGHVDARHGMRLLLQNSIVAFAVTWFIGDVSMLAAAAPTALLQAKYSRDLEREADRHAMTTLAGNGIPRERFAVMLERIEASARESGEAGAIAGYLSSHPLTRERLEAIRGGATP